MTNEQAIRRISLIMEQPEVPGSLELAYQWVCEDIIESDYDQWIQNDLSEYLAAFPEICSELADESIANGATIEAVAEGLIGCLLYTSPSPRDGLLSRMPSSA